MTIVTKISSISRKNHRFLKKHPEAVCYTSPRKQSMGEAHGFDNFSYQEAFHSTFETTEGE